MIFKKLNKESYLNTCPMLKLPVFFFFFFNIRGNIHVNERHRKLGTLRNLGGTLEELDISGK